jgi:hypothetical protein
MPATTIPAAYTHIQMLLMFDDCVLFAAFFAGISVFSSTMNGIDDNLTNTGEGPALLGFWGVSQGDLGGLMPRVQRLCGQMDGEAAAHVPLQRRSARPPGQRRAEGGLERLL